MKDVYSFITDEENNFRTLKTRINDDWEWSMYDHIKKAVLYKNSRFLTGNNDDKPFKNLVRPLLNLQYRAEGFDVKDIVLFVNEASRYWKSFLLKKYHAIWARQNGMDTFIDEMVESYADFGGSLVKKVKGKRPELVPMPRLAFCDTTNILAGPICEKHFFAPDELREMDGWENTEEVIMQSEDSRETSTTGMKTETPGKYVVVYELHGTFPQWWLNDSEEESKEEGDENVRQVQIVTLYQDKNGNKKGITLFKNREPKNPYKLILRDEIYGRGLGLGGVEELEEDQVWTNNAVIRMQSMLNAASKVLFQTSDKEFKNKNKLVKAEQMQIFTTDEGKRIDQINTSPININLFERSAIEWEDHAKLMASATESLLGETPPSGTPFRLQERLVMEGKGIHEYRKGKIARFLDEIYQEWIIPELVKDISNGTTFLAELDPDEMQEISKAVVTNKVNRRVVEKILRGEVVDDGVTELIKQEEMEKFQRGGTKRFFEILKDEFKRAPIDVEVNIAGKQRDLAGLTEKLVNIFRQIAAAPQLLQDPRMMKLFNQILEASGLSPIDFSQQVPQQIPQQLPQVPQSSPIQ